MSERAWKYLLYLLLFAFLLFPYATILYLSPDVGLFNGREATESFLYTTLQAGLGALLTLVLGGLGGLALIGLSERQRKWLSATLILPSLVPTLFVMVSLFNLFQFLNGFPFGLTGIVLAHVIINVGLATVMISGFLQRSLFQVADLALVEGAKKIWFYWESGVRMNQREWMLTFFFFFALYFSSFSVPILAGDLRVPVIEVLIFEKIKDVATWPEAILLSFGQIFILLGLGSMIARPQTMELRRRGELHTLRPRIWGVLPAMSVFLFVILGNLSGVNEGLSRLKMIPDFSAWVMELSLNSLAIGFGVGISVACLCIATVWLFPTPKFQKFLLAYVAPSSILTGFSLLVLPPWSQSDVTYAFKIVIGIALISFPIGYRLGIEKSLSKLHRQVEVARVLGASKNLVFTKILWPQARESVFFVSGISAFWGIGDYALSSIVAGRDLSLALVVKTLMSSYRLELATVLVWLVLLLGLLLLILFWRGWRVFGAKSATTV